MRERAEAGRYSGQWVYRPWPDSILPVVGPHERQKFQELTSFNEKLKRDRAWLTYKLGEGPRPPAEPEPDSLAGGS